MWRAMEGRLVPEDPCHGLGVHVQEKRWSRPGSKPTHSGHNPHKIFDPPQPPKKVAPGERGGVKIKKFYCLTLTVRLLPTAWSRVCD